MLTKRLLSNDVQKNLDQPLKEILQLALERGYLLPQIRTGVRTGDTLPKDRVAMLKAPPHILVTTPESLYLLLTSAKARENLRCVRTVIVDEIHAMADDNQDIYKEFKQSVNMTASELKKWLSSDDAKSVGWSKSEGKNTGSSTKTGSSDSEP